MNYEEFLEQYRQFISRNKTEREVVKAVEEVLPQERGTFVVPFRHKSLFAANISEPAKKSLNLIAVHADSPRLDFKQNPFIEQAGVVQAKTHYYGGIRKHQWLARPLAIHGVVVLKNGFIRNVCIGESPEDPVFCVEDLLPHLAKKQREEKLAKAFEGEKLNVILGSPLKAKILDMLELEESDFITAEIEVVPAGPARYVGVDKSLIGGYGQDDRSNLFCALQAFKAISGSSNIALMVWDKEEIGSCGATGAESKFLEYCLEDLNGYIGMSRRDLAVNTYALSADVLPALDPDYQSAHEKQNAAILGKGPCFAKFSGSKGKVGANDANAEYYAAVVRNLNENSVPWQAGEIGKVDFGGGGTVAKFLSQLGCQVIDFGVPVLSMHSPFELVNCDDLYNTYRAFRSFYKASFNC